MIIPAHSRHNVFSQSVYSLAEPTETFENKSMNLTKRCIAEEELETNWNKPMSEECREFLKEETADN